MSTLLRRELAPITEAAWTEIDDQARDVFATQLSGRRLVNFHGPYGWEHAAVNLGRLDIRDAHTEEGIGWGTRTVLPLVEVRVPFKLDQLELDEVTRGAADPDLGPLVEAAKKMAHFEERVIYRGFSEGNMAGIIQASPHDAIDVSGDPVDYPVAVAMGLEALRRAGVNGPYALVFGLDRFEMLMQSTKTGYPLQRVIRDMIGGEIHWSPALEGGVLFSTRGGDFELTVGQDLSIGYTAHAKDHVELCIAESLAFRVLQPEAAIALK
jgi:uncharacterized linocin/CFP29 family protein